MNDYKILKKDNIIWMLIGGIVGAALGVFAFYDSWLG